MKRKSGSELDERSRYLLEIAFQGFVGKSYQAPTESDYIRAILGLWEFVQRNVPIKGKPGRPPKNNDALKEDLFLKMQMKMRWDGLGSDKAAQALFREKNYGRTSWKSLKTAYFSYRRDLIGVYIPDISELDDSESEERKIDTQLWIAIAWKSNPSLLLAGV